jgi:RNA polymerase sigma factor (sigma-70 family)
VAPEHRKTPEDRDDFTKVVESYGRPFYSYAYSRLRDHHTTQDVVQCAIIKLHKKWMADPETVEKNRAYAFTILRNAVRDHLRAQRRESDISDRSDVGMPDTHPGPERHAVARDLLERALGELPERHAEVFFLRHYAGYGPSEIGELLGLATATVSTYLSSAKSILRETLATLDY